MEMFAMSERIDIQRDLKRFYVDQIPLVDDETQDSWTESRCIKLQ